MPNRAIAKGEHLVNMSILKADLLRTATVLKTEILSETKISTLKIGLDGHYSRVFVKLKDHNMELEEVLFSCQKSR